MNKNNNGSTPLFARLEALEKRVAAQEETIGKLRKIALAHNTTINNLTSLFAVKVPPKPTQINKAVSAALTPKATKRDIAANSLRAMQATSKKARGE